MSTGRSIYPTFPSLQHEAQRAWQWQRRLEAGETHPLEAMIELNTIYDEATNPRLRRLCETIAFRLFGVPRTAPAAEPVVEAFGQ